MADSTINDLQTYSKEDAIGGFFPLQKGNGNGKYPFADITNVIDIVYEETPFATLKAAYDNGQSVRMTSSGIAITFAPSYNDGDDADDVVMFSALVSNRVTGSDQYYIISVTKGEEGQPDVWVSHNEFIGTNDVKVLSVDSSSWTGAKTYTLQTKDAGKVVDFGTLPDAVTSLVLDTPNNVNMVLFQFVCPSSLTSVTINKNNVSIPTKGMPDSFTAGNILQISVCNGVALAVEVEPVQAPLAMTPPPSSGDEQDNEGEV